MSSDQSYAVCAILNTFKNDKDNNELGWGFLSAVMPHSDHGLAVGALWRAPKDVELQLEQVSGVLERLVRKVGRIGSMLPTIRNPQPKSQPQ
jgi:hypothetical protein